jgi:histidinol phosphatase-like PHP family hydrolase
MKGFVEQPADDSPASVGRNLLKFFRSGVTSGPPTSIAHPFVPFGFWAQFAGAIASISDDEFIEAFGLAATHKVAIEITMAFLPATPTPEKPNPLWTLDTPVRLLALARQAGCRFTFGTDAHDAAGQKHLPALSELIKLAGITDANILTF